MNSSTPTGLRQFPPRHQLKPYTRRPAHLSFYPRAKCGPSSAYAACDSSQLAYRSLDIPPRLFLILIVKPIRPVNSLATQKAFENLRSLRTKNDLRHPRVFLPDLRLILQEALLGLPQDAQIDIDHHSCIGILAGLVRLRRHHQFNYRIRNQPGNSGLIEALLCQLRAALLVIARSRIIHGIMKPKRQFNHLRLPNQMPCRIKFAEALSNVLLIVIVPVAFSISVGQPTVPRPPVSTRLRRFPQPQPSLRTRPVHFNRLSENAHGSTPTPIRPSRARNRSLTSSHVGTPAIELLYLHAHQPL
jgi:hypothetical protein